MENSGELQVTWTRTQDKAFETAIVTFPNGTPNRWKSIAEKIDGKSPEEVKKHHDDLVDDVAAICAGVLPLPEYNNGPVINVEVEKKNIRTWTIEEHMLFLRGLDRYGKGHWRSISRDYVKTKTPTQIASHAQKYFFRQNAKDKSKRKSIHDLPREDSIPVLISSSPQNFNGGSSFGYNNTANGNRNQEGLMITNGESISSTSQVFNHRGSQGHDIDETHFYNHSSMGKAGISQHWNSPSARFAGDEGRSLNGCSSNIYHQEGISEYNSDTMLRYKHSTSSPNQFPMENNGNEVNTNGHFISPQSQFSPNGGMTGYNYTNMINQSTPPPLGVYHDMGPQLPNSQRNDMPHRSFYMSNADTKVVPSVGTSNNQVKANGDSTSLPGQYSNEHK